MKRTLTTECDGKKISARDATQEMHERVELSIFRGEMSDDWDPCTQLCASALEIDRWVNAIEEAMKNPVVEIIDTPYGPGMRGMHILNAESLPIGTKLYAFPPYAEAEREQDQSYAGGGIHSIFNACMFRDGCKATDAEAAHLKQILMRVRGTTKLSGLAAEIIDDALAGKGAPL